MDDAPVDEITTGVIDAVENTVTFTGTAAADGSVSTYTIRNPGTAKSQLFVEKTKADGTISSAGVVAGSMEDPSTYSSNIETSEFEYNKDESKVKVSYVIDNGIRVHQDFEATYDESAQTLTTGDLDLLTKTEVDETARFTFHTDTNKIDASFTRLAGVVDEVDYSTAEEIRTTGTEDTLYFDTANSQLVILEEDIATGERKSRVLELRATSNTEYIATELVNNVDVVYRVDPTTGVTVKETPDGSGGMTAEDKTAEDF